MVYNEIREGRKCCFIVISRSIRLQINLIRLYKYIRFHFQIFKYYQVQQSIILNIQCSFYALFDSILISISKNVPIYSKPR